MFSGPYCMLAPLQMIQMTIVVYVENLIMNDGTNQ